MDSKVSLVKCKNYEPRLVEEATRRAIDLLGGISIFIKPASVVLVKPNLLVAREPESGVTTHPEVVRAVIRVLKDINCRIVVGDSPSAWGNREQDVDEVYRRTGIKKVCQEEEVTLVKFNKRRWHGKFPLTTWLDNCDYIVNVPKFKTHNLTILTGGIKNLYGLIPGSFKAELHKHHFEADNFSRILVEIYQKAKPALSVIDGIVAMEGDGPGAAGKLRQQDLIIAGVDCVAIDAVLAAIMGIPPLDVPTTREAARRHLGIAELDSISIIGEQLKTLNPKPFLLPSAATLTSRLPRPVVELLKKLIKVRPYIEGENCIKCFFCLRTCPTKAIKTKKERMVFAYAKCIACFCCQEVCPNAAIKVKKSVFAKLIGL
jgi:uncharacterized protein (DUF362 family)/Pyruvate/2-oxoacid:ferredoxin oxidoreductase delta subunit